jgi:hypothetical protein
MPGLRLKAADPFTSPPTILTQPASVVAQVGGSVVFTVGATGAFPLEYQWLRNGVQIPGATTSSHGMANIRPEDAAIFQVLVKNAFGSVLSASASLTVVTPLLITKDPTNQVAKAGADVTFSVQASSKLPVSYLWFKDGNLIPGVATNVLLLKNVQDADAGSYTALAYTTEGGLRSQPALLTIIGALPPLILKHPTNQTRLVGASAGFFVQVSGGMPLSYRWFKNGLLLSNAVSSNLTLETVQESDAGAYHCVVTNRVGTANSVSATLVVQVPPIISVHPTNKIAFAWATVSFSAESKGVPAPAYRWFKNGAAIPNASSSSLSLVNAQPSDNGEYFMLASNLVGVATSRVASLVVHVPARIKTQPAAQTVFVGNTARLAVEAEGELPLTFQWFKGTNELAAATNAAFILANAQPADAGSYSVVVSNAFARVVSGPATLTVRFPVTITLQPTNQAVMIGSNATFRVGASAFDGGALSFQWLKNGAPIPTAIDAELKLSRVQSADAGEYQARVFGIAGATTSSVARLIVNFPPTIRSQPENLTVRVGARARFFADVAGTPPLFFRWSRNQTVITNATNAVIELEMAHYAEPAEFRYVVTNAFGAATSAVARLTVRAPPEFKVQPLGQSVVVGSSASLLVEATGTPSLSYQWLKNAEPVPGATNWILVLRNLRMSDAGVYRVVVRNVLGQAESAGARLAVGFAAAITVHPASRATRVGDPVTFAISVANESTPPLSFQWLKDDQSIAGATNATLSLNAIKAADTGKYSVLVSNPFGQARSVDAVLSLRSIFPVRGDFDRDGSADIVFQDKNGALASWHMQGVDMISASLLDSQARPEPGWRIAGSGDFDQDGNEDLLLQHENGALAAWFMNGRQLRLGALIAVDLAEANEWKVAGTADFNQDDKPDLLVRDGNGRLAAWMVAGGRVVSTALLNLGNPIDLAWEVVGAEDFNEDGRPDVVFQHRNGTLALWYLDGFATASPALFSPSHPGADWRVVGVTDRNGDRKPDLLFQHQKDGTLALWLLDGARLSQPRLLNPSKPGGTWRVVAP